jgi:hypothetical protein
MHGHRTVSGRANVQLDAVCAEGERFPEGLESVLSQVCVRTPVGENESHGLYAIGRCWIRKCS